MDIKVGDRVTCRYLNTYNRLVEVVRIVSTSSDVDYYRKMTEAKEDELAIEILKIERPNYEIVEEKKELLTDEEREFLKLYIKFSNKIIDGIKKQDGYLNFMQDDYEDNFIELINDMDDFENLTEGKIYTISELGLES